MPTTRKPKPYRHPRSLDALFPVPKVRRCTRGHTQTPEWKKHHGCSTCLKQDQLAEAARLAATEEAKQAARREREAATAALRPLPDPYVLRDYSGRIVGTFRAGGRRGRRRR